MKSKFPDGPVTAALFALPESECTMHGLSRDIYAGIKMLPIRMPEYAEFAKNDLPPTECENESNPNVVVMHAACRGDWSLKGAQPKTTGPKHFAQTLR